MSATYCIHLLGPTGRYLHHGSTELSLEKYAQAEGLLPFKMIPDNKPLAWRMTAPDGVQYRAHYTITACPPQWMPKGKVLLV